MNKEKNSQTDVKTQTLQAGLAVSFYMVVSIALVFLNRLVLIDKTEKAGALFVSWYQFIVSYVIILFVATFCQKIPGLNIFPPIQYKLGHFVKVIPVSICYLAMIGLNNKCLEYVSVSGYQIVRSLTIVFNILLSLLIFCEKTSLRVTIACIGVTIGFVLGVEGEVQLSFRGALYGVLSSVFVALYSIVVKSTMDIMDKDQYLLMEYNTPLAIIILTPIVWFSGEFDVFQVPRSFRFWKMQTITGIFGFIINIAIFLNIKYTTPLTHNLSGTVKACLQTILAYFVLEGETFGVLKIVGTALVIGFSAYYTYVRKLEMQQKAEKEGDNEELLADQAKELDTIENVPIDGEMDNVPLDDLKETV